MGRAVAELTADAALAAAVTAGRALDEQAALADPQPSTDCGQTVEVATISTVMETNEGTGSYQMLGGR